MIKWLFTITLCFASLVFAEEDQISSQHATYDGSSLKLSGDVILDHAFGLMKSQEAVLDKAEGNKEFPFSLLWLKDKVNLALSSSATLLCNEARLDFSKLDADFIAADGEKVVFQDKFSSKIGKKKNFFLEAPSAKMKIGIRDVQGKKREYFVEKVEVDNGATFKSESNLVIEAPRVVYQKTLGKDQYYGEIHAFSSGENLCKLIMDQDIIESKRIQFDLTQEIIALAEAKGTILSLLQNSSHLNFSCNAAFWDEKNKTLSMQGNVVCEDAQLGTYRAQKSLLLQLEEKDGKTSLRSIKGEQGVQLIFHDEKQNITHELTCPGLMEVGNEEFVAKFTSSSSAQVCYKSPLGTLFANRGIIEYSQVDGKLQPSTMGLKGSVHLVIQDAAHPNSERIGFADRVQLNFETQTMILQAEPGKRVLFLDDAKGITISAPEVQMVKDPKTKEDHVRGLGNVRFTFTDAEKAMIKKWHPSHGESR